MSKTELFARQIPGGVLTINNESLNTGNIYWVSSVTGTDVVGGGYSPAVPFASLAFALAQCTANNDDRIYVLANHSENVSSAALQNFSVAGVSVIGLGQGSSRPTFVWTATAGTITMASANSLIKNCIFDLSQTSAIVSGIVVSAAGCQILNNTFLVGKAGTGTAPTQAILTTAGANRLKIDSNRFVGPSATPTTVSAGTTCITLVGGTGIEVTNNWIFGWFTTSVGGLQCITTLTSDVRIDGNVIINATASSTKAITLITGSLGTLVNNRLGILSGSAPVTADSVWCGGNTYSASQSVTAGTASTF